MCWGTTLPFSLKQFQVTLFCLLIYVAVQKKVIQFHEGFQNSPGRGRTPQAQGRLLGGLPLICKPWFSWVPNSSSGRKPYRFSRMITLQINNSLVNSTVVSTAHPTPLFCSYFPEFISHSFSLMELKFLYQHVLPDLTGKVVVDVGSRLGAVLFAVTSSTGIHILLLSQTFSLFSDCLLLLLHLERVILKGASHLTLWTV